MAKIPNQPQDIFESLKQDCLSAYGNDLVSLMLYGSAASGAYMKGKSDINLLLVLTKEGISNLDMCLPLVKNWRKSNVAVPLMITKEFIASSLDAYPIEFLNMKNNSILIYGENVLESLIFKPEDMRLQIERELKGKILWLREGYLASEGSARQIRELIVRSFTAFVAIFNALLYLKTGEAPRARQETIQRMSESYGVNESVFESCLMMKSKTDAFSGADVVKIFKKYLQEAEKVCHQIDRW